MNVPRPISSPRAGPALAVRALRRRQQLRDGALLVVHLGSDLLDRRAAGRQGRRPGSAWPSPAADLAIGHQAIERVPQRGDGRGVQCVAGRIDRALQYRHHLQRAERARLDEFASLEQMAIVGQHGAAVLVIGGRRLRTASSGTPRSRTRPEDRPRHLVGVAGRGGHEHDEVGGLEELDGEGAVGELDAVEVRRVDEHQSAACGRIGPQVERVPRQSGPEAAPRPRRRGGRGPPGDGWWDAARRRG